MITLGFGTYHFANAQINSSNTSVDILNNQSISMSNASNVQGSERTINDISNLTVVTGNWRIVNDTLHGFSDENKSMSPINNIITSPETTESAKVSTTFKVNNLNSTVANYAAIVYSFVDSDNLERVGINILKNSVYAVGYNLNNGNEVSEPSWPGSLTNLTYSPGTTYNMTLINQGSALDLFINGTKYLTKSIENGQTNLGEVGLFYSRIPDIEFFDFKTEPVKQQQLISNGI